MSYKAKAESSFPFYLVVNTDIAIRHMSLCPGSNVRFESTIRKIWQDQFRAASWVQYESPLARYMPLLSRSISFIVPLSRLLRCQGQSLSP